MKIRISKTLLMAWLECPIKFKNLLEGKVEEESYSMYLGDMFHYRVADFWRNVIFDSESKKLLLPEIDSKDERLKKMFDNFKKYVMRRWEASHNNLNLFFPKYIERKFETVENVDGEVVELVGVVDMVDSLEDGSYGIVEWKTGSPTQKNLRNVKIELVFYKYLLEKNGLKVEKGAVYYPYYNKFFVFDLNESDVDDILKIIKSIVFHLKTNTFYHNLNCRCDKGVV